jgi:hypothetical protein
MASAGMGGGEHDVERGSPFGEDIYAYHRSGQEHVQWTYQQTMFRDAGTSGDWSKPSGGYDPKMEHYTPPAWEAWASRGAALVGATALTLSVAVRGDVDHRLRLFDLGDK